MNTRAPYHHGDLRNALIDAAAQLAAGGGPEAVTVRAAARHVGVTPTAAYRHFAGHDDLLLAAKEESVTRLGAAMRRRVDDLGPVDETEASVRARLNAMGRGYIDFALGEPGLYRTAFGQESHPMDEDKEVKLADANHPYSMLVGVLADLVKLGVVREEDLEGTCNSAWAFAHGLSLLLIDGPFTGLGEDEKAHIVEDTLRVFGQTIIPPAAPPSIESP
ncbi:TetR/AcrR family transcriptional regulator [Luteipulveratus mongoliensis]|uniref:HTH tetR-type domain-containing protein n=1 Tax=Luteipulveratus mongoliensis TaxID=571913 RepID=A0A0K1JGY8_9MICO|nr:TetR/AcrR family transcriptional regulator [Luteipulveratus mongoliensis]AKU15848.1 hypothetical protein VV02_08250 [Luteipulveratus mongoliensis]